MKPIHIATLILLGAIWGASFLFIRVAVPAFGPMMLMFIRVLLAGMVLVIYAAAVGRLPDWRAHWHEFLIMGALNAAIPFTLIALAQLTLTASLAAILNSTTPLFTALVAAVWIRERLTPAKIIGLLMGVLGVSILVGGSPLALNNALLLAALASLGAALCYGIGAVYTVQHIKGLSSSHASMGQLLGAALLLALPAFASAPDTLPPANAVWAILALALLSTSFAYFLYFFLLRNIGATRASTVTFLVPVFGSLWGVIFLDEPFNLSMLIGMGIILMSVSLVIGTHFRKSGLPATSAS